MRLCSYEVIWWRVRVDILGGETSKANRVCRFGVTRHCEIQENIGLCTEVLTYVLTYLVHGAANRFSASPEILRNLWKTKVHYRIYKSPQSVSILRQINPIYAPQTTS